MMPPTSMPSPTMSACMKLVQELTLRERVGQLLMVGVSSSGPTESDAEVLATTRAGSVLLLGNSTIGRKAIEDVTRRTLRAARQPEHVQTMIAVDQEGGSVQRLKGTGFDRIPSAVQQARLSDRRLAARAKAWGQQLQSAGINANLAPVADVVPRSMIDRNEPIGQLRRGYGSDPVLVAAKVRAFVSGMAKAGVATSLKHFPGLGRVRGNTDFRSDVVDTVTRRGDPALAGFRSGVEAGADMVMVSSATYSNLDPKQRAAFSPTVLRGMIRGDLDFTGVIISDDLAATAMQDVSPRSRVTRFLAAGGDLAIIGDPAMTKVAADAVIVRARQDPAFAELVTASATRVAEVKQRHGMADC
jgi:beta-N-acetylhexosaminidase